MSDQSRKPKFTPGQKLTIAVLIFFSVLIIGALALLIAGSINLPF